MPTTTTGIKLDLETQRRLKQLGELKDRSPHWIMKTAIQEYLTREEVVERERLEDEERWQRYVQTGAFVDHDEMMAWMGELAKEARRREGAKARRREGAKARRRTAIR